MGKILAEKQELYHVECVDVEARGGMTEMDSENFEQDDVCAECGNPLTDEPEPSDEDKKDAGA